jgi:hypothetical protein
MTDSFRDRARLKAILVLAATLAFVTSPLLVTGFNGYDPQAFPVPQVDPPAQPAGWAFSIWGPIYLWLVVHAGAGLILRSDDRAWDAGRWGLFGSLALGASWLAVANVAPIPATVQIWAMLALALVALFNAPAQPDRFLLLGPVALYAGWLTAASWVSVALVLGGWGILGAKAAAVVAVLGAAVTAGTVQMRLRRAPEYGLAVVWALIALVAQNIADPLLAGAAGAGAAAVALAVWRATRA